MGLHSTHSGKNVSVKGNESVMVNMRKTDASQCVVLMGKIKEKRSIQRRINLSIPNNSPIKEVLTEGKKMSSIERYTSC